MERSPDASKTSQTAADGGVEVERATNSTVAGAYQSWDLRIAQVASVGANLHDSLITTGKPSLGYRST